MMSFSLGVVTGAPSGSGCESRPPITYHLGCNDFNTNALVLQRLHCCIDAPAQAGAVIPTGVVNIMCHERRHLNPRGKAAIGKAWADPPKHLKQLPHAADHSQGIFHYEFA